MYLLLRGTARMGRDNGEPVDEETQTYIAARMYSQAWKLLVDTYYGAVFRYCVMLVRDGDRARDITQDVFTAVCRGLPSIREAAKIRAWLFGIARNKCRRYWEDYRGHQDKEQQHPESIAELNHGPHPPDPAVTAVAEEQLRLLRRALDQLPQDLQEVLVLLYSLEDHVQCSPDDIAGILKISRATVYRRRDEGLAELRRIMHDG